MRFPNERAIVVGAVAITALLVGGRAANAAPSPAVVSLTQRACQAVIARGLSQREGRRGDRASVCRRLPPASAPAPWMLRRVALTSAPDGTIINRQRIATSAHVALDVVAYASDGLTVGGLLCYPNDGAPHSVVIHVPGGTGGVFNSSGGGDMVQTCIDWAQLHGRTAFAPSLRGNDGGDGVPELCGGEADDVVAAAQMVRSLEIADARRVGLVGGSVGGCVVLRAAPRIPDLAAVVAFVPPTSWKDLIRFHRTAWSSAVEVDCDGVSHEWNIGGPAFADALESVICGHANCSDEDFLKRSPLPYIDVQTAPTLIVSAESDNVVPLEQELLWSLFRQRAGHPVSIVPVNRCDPPGTPPLAMDVHVFVRGAFHLLTPGPVSSGMLFLMAQMDRQE